MARGLKVRLIFNLLALAYFGCLLLKIEKDHVKHEHDRDILSADSNLVFSIFEVKRSNVCREKWQILGR
jgi:hypothetical protein